MNKGQRASSGIKAWSKDDRPRERLLSFGAEASSTAELIAILFRSGTSSEGGVVSAVDIARKVLALADNNLTRLGRLGIDELTTVKGVGPAKAITLLAALELGRRRKREGISESNSIASPSDAGKLFLEHLGDLIHEEFWAMYLNSANHILELCRISQGGITGTVTDIQGIVRKALALKATGLIVAHNHPSGALAPSEHDIIATNKLKAAAVLFDIRLLDHFIIGQGGYYSMRQSEQL